MALIKMRRKPGNEYYMSSLKQLPDGELIREYGNGNSAALSELILRYKDQLYTSLYLLVKDKELAEDIFQDVFVRVINSLKNNKYKHEGMFLAWIVRIAHNLYLDHLRKSKRTPAIKSIDALDGSDGLGRAVEIDDTRLLEEQRLKRIQEVIGLLPIDQQEIIILRHYGGLSFKEIAKIMHISINTALGRMRYALMNLRKIMNEQEGSAY